MELTEIRYKLRRSIGNTEATKFDYEEVECAAAVTPDEDPAQAYAELKAYCQANATKVKQAPTGGATNVGSAPAGQYSGNRKPQQRSFTSAPVSNGQKQYAPTDWTKALGKFDFPFRKPGFDFEGAKSVLKELKCRFNGKKEGGDNCWYIFKQEALDRVPQELMEYFVATHPSMPAEATTTCQQGEYIDVPQGDEEEDNIPF